jgi:plasmid stability protein
MTTELPLQCSYIACMPAVTIRDVPDETRNTLASRAARRGQSLQEYLRASLIEMADHPDIDELLARVRQRKAASGSTLHPEAILDHLAAERK